MYGFRKPFTVASFEGLSYFGVDYKILIIIVQAIGYFISKFIGIKFISELKPEKRIAYLFTFIAIAELSLLGFAAVPAPYNILFMFINGIPLGMIWELFSLILKDENHRNHRIIFMFKLCGFFWFYKICRKISDGYFFHFRILDAFFSTGLIFIIPLILFGLFLKEFPNLQKKIFCLKIRDKLLNGKERKALIQQFLYPLFVSYFYISV